MPEIIKKVWGREEVIANTPLYCGKILHLKKGAMCSLHYHPVKMETFYILKGSVRMEMDIEPGSRGPRSKTLMRPGDTVLIPPRFAHRFFGIEKSRILEISTHHDDKDVVRLEPSVPA